MTRLHRMLRLALVLVFALTVFATTGLAQEKPGWLDRLRKMAGGGPNVSVHQRSDARVKAAFKEAMAPAGNSVVKIRAGKKDLALGTVVDSQGLIVTKFSEVDDHLGELFCVFRDGRELGADLKGVIDDHDLAVLAVEAEDLQPIRWRENAPEVGVWLVSPGVGELPESIGVVSVVPRRIGWRPPFLGIAFDMEASLPKIQEVFPESGAAEAGVKVNDVITAVNNQVVKTREAMIQAIRRFRPGQQIRLKVKRGAEELELEAKLGVRSDEQSKSKRDVQNRMGGPLSERRTGFPSVLQHDSYLKPDQCGGPVVDLNGQAIGVNIARAGRVMSFALPAELVVKLVDETKAGKHAPPQDLVPAPQPEPSQMASLEQKLAQLKKDLVAADGDRTKADLDETLATSKLKELKQAREQLDKEFAAAEAKLKSAKQARIDADLAMQAIRLSIEKLEQEIEQAKQANRD